MTKLANLLIFPTVAKHARLAALLCPTSQSSHNSPPNSRCSLAKPSLPNPPNCPNLPTFKFSPCCATCLPCPTSKPSQLALPRRPNLPTCPAAQPSQLAPTFPTCPNLPAFELSGSTFVQLAHYCPNFACGIAAQVYDIHSECNAKELEEKVLEEVVLESKLLEVLREATESRLHNDAPNLKSAIGRGRPTAKKKKLEISFPGRPNGLLSTLWGIPGTSTKICEKGPQGTLWVAFGAQDVQFGNFLGTQCPQNGTLWDPFGEPGEPDCYFGAWWGHF